MSELRVEDEGPRVVVGADGEPVEIPPTLEAIADLGNGLVRLAGHVTKEQIRRSLQPGQWSMGVVQPDGGGEYHFCLKSADGTEEIWWRMTVDEAAALRDQLTPPSTVIIPGLAVPS